MVSLLVTVSKLVNVFTLYLFMEDISIFLKRSAHLPNEIAFTVDRYKRMRKKKRTRVWELVNNA